MEAPDDLRWSGAYVWVRVDGDEATLGVTAYAQEQLGDVVYLQLPDEGDALTSGSPFGLIQSSKTVEDLVSPIDGEVIASNDEAASHPRIVNASPCDQGWLVRARPADAQQIDALMDATAYQAFVASISE